MISLVWRRFFKWRKCARSACCCASSCLHWIISLSFLYNLSSFLEAVPRPGNAHASKFSPLLCYECLSFPPAAICPSVHPSGGGEERQDEERKVEWSEGWSDSWSPVRQGETNYPSNESHSSSLHLSLLLSLASRTPLHDAHLDSNSRKKKQPWKYIISNTWNLQILLSFSLYRCGLCVKVIQSTWAFTIIWKPKRRLKLGGCGGGKESSMMRLMWNDRRVSSKSEKRKAT